MPNHQLPHHKLLAYGKAVALVCAVREAGVEPAHLRDQALRAATSAALNAAEGAARVSPADKARAFAIARGEASEAAAAVEIAFALGSVSAEAVARVASIANEVVAMLTPLARRQASFRSRP